MSAICPNCGTSLSCSCKLRTASDGNQCCTKCLEQYEKGPKKPQQAKKVQEKPTYLKIRHFHP